jgi:OOP family OmpA-OmpF porin
MNARYAMAGAVVVALVSSCGGIPDITGVSDVNQARKIGDAGEDFNSKLAKAYRDFALFEADQMVDWPDAVHFAKKANDARAGKPVAPENPSNWKIKEARDRQELQAGYSRIVNALAAGAATKAPAAAARAQVQFDCWVEQQEENWQYDHIAACKTGFQQAMAALDDAMRVAPTSAAPQAPVTQAPNTGPFLVFFDWDSTTLEPGALDILRTVADNAKAAVPPQIQVVGHADRSGTTEYNVGLSNRRARAVADRLVANGLSRNDIVTRGRGESEPLVTTADGVREPQNRRVEITFRVSRPTAQLGETSDERRDAAQGTDR